MVTYPIRYIILVGKMTLDFLQRLQLTISVTYLEMILFVSLAYYLISKQTVNKDIWREWFFNHYLTFANFLMSKVDHLSLYSISCFFWSNKYLLANSLF